MRPLLLTFALAVSLAVSAVTYRWVDEQGNVVYSDKPHPGAEVIEEKEVQTIHAPPVPPITPRESTAPPAVAGYERVAVVSPEDDTQIRENAGNVTVTITVEPALQTMVDLQSLVDVEGLPALLEQAVEELPGALAVGGSDPDVRGVLARKHREAR